MNAHGCDVSRYQHPCDYKKGADQGLQFVFVRASVGDYYSDASLRDSINGYRDQGCLVSAYLVTAPKDPSYTRRISAQAHLDRFFNTIGDLKFDFPAVIDAELDRGENIPTITQLQRDVVIGLYNHYNEYPIIYTRQTWWDTYVAHDTLWHHCDLFPARYASWLTSPWSDGHCKFRDWNEWKFWQYTSHADGPYWGFNSLNGDLDWFNGDTAAMYCYAGLPQPLSLKQKVDILWREAEQHGWNLLPT